MCLRGGWRNRFYGCITEVCGQGREIEEDMTEELETRGMTEEGIKEYNTMNIDGKTKTIGLIGCPVEHTLSPVIHNGLSRIFAQNTVYLPFHVEENRVGEAVKGAYGLGILGLNVTVPHKQHVMEYLADIDAVAEAIGAVNTLVRTKKGYKGYNTDMEGLRQAVRAEGILLNNQTVVVLGAGGASKAVVYMCMLEGAKKIYLLNRTLSKAEDIAKAMDFPVVPMRLEDYKAISEENLYVFQATSIGLSPDIDKAVIEDAAFYKKVEVGYDLIYNPAETKFMRMVKAAGGRAYNGLKMLLYQGVLAYSYWTDISFSRLETACDTIYAELYHAVHGMHNIVLVGFMGSGKSTVGTALAQRLNMTFLDTDAYIEERETMSVTDIFSERGETYFRQTETDVIGELLKKSKHTVLATGGGMPLRRENADLLNLLGETVYLCASPEEVYNRIAGDTKRPLLQTENPRKRIAALMEERHARYEEASGYHIDVDGKSVEQIVDEIVYRLGL